MLFSGYYNFVLTYTVYLMKPPQKTFLHEFFFTYSGPTSGLWWLVTEHAWESPTMKSHWRLQEWQCKTGKTTRYQGQDCNHMSDALRTRTWDYRGKTLIPEKWEHKNKYWKTTRAKWPDSKYTSARLQTVATHNSTRTRSQVYKSKVMRVR